MWITLIKIKRFNLLSAVAIISALIFFTGILGAGTFLNVKSAFGYGGGGGGGGSAAIPSSISSYNEPLTVSPTQEGTVTQKVSSDTKVVVSIPRGAVAQSTTFTTDAGSLSVDSTPVGSANATMVGGYIFNVTANDSANRAVVNFSSSLIITLTIPGMPTDLSNLGVYYLNNSTNEWVKIPGAIFDLTNGTAQFEVDHLSQFAIFEVAGLPDVIATETSPDRHPSGSLVTIDGNSAVYLIEGIKRKAFPHANVYFSHYSDFDNVITISPEELVSYQLSQNVIYNTNSLIKIQTDPKVYQVMNASGLIEWIPTEEKAAELFGADWAKLIYDVPVTFWLDYSTA